MFLIRFNNRTILTTVHCIVINRDYYDYRCKTMHRFVIVASLISIDNPNEAKIAGSQHQITSTMETIPIVLKRRNVKIPPPPSSERKPEDTTKTEIYTIEFDDASTNNENKSIANHNEAKTAGSQDQVTNTMEMKPIVLKSRKEKIPPPSSSVCKPEDPIKTDSKSAESAEAIVHRDQTLPRDRHKTVISQTDYKRLLNITTKPSAIKVISKQGTVGRKSATDRVIHVITVAKRLKKKKKLQQDVRLHVSRGLSKEEIKVVMKNVT